jgi:hypothetical protein
MTSNHLPGSAPNQGDRDEVESVALDYIEGWYQGDARRMERALHEELVKRTLNEGDAGHGDLRSVSKARMVELTRASGGRGVADPAIRVVVDDVSGNIASARTYCADFVDFLHLVKISGAWSITHVLFRTRT